MSRKIRYVCVGYTHADFCVSLSTQAKKLAELKITCTSNLIVDPAKLVADKVYCMFMLLAPHSTGRLRASPLFNSRFMVLRVHCCNTSSNQRHKSGHISCYSMMYDTTTLPVLFVFSYHIISWKYTGTC